jgi:hypothetical protein
LTNFAPAGLGTMTLLSDGSVMAQGAGCTRTWYKLTPDNKIDSHVGLNGSAFGYFNGDFNYDGQIDGDDYFVIDSNIGGQGGVL